MLSVYSSNTSSLVLLIAQEVVVRLVYKTQSGIHTSFQNKGYISVILLSLNSDTLMAEEWRWDIPLTWLSELDHSPHSIVTARRGRRCVCDLMHTGRTSVWGLRKVSRRGGGVVFDENIKFDSQNLLFTAMENWSQTSGSPNCWSVSHCVGNCVFMPPVSHFRSVFVI